MALALLTTAPLAALSPQAPATTLSRVDQIRSLSPDEAMQHRSLLVKGVVTFNSPEYRIAFVQDDTAGIFVHNRGEDFSVDTGMLVELQGITFAGDFAPTIGHPVFKVLARTPYPKPTQETIAGLMTGKHDSQWVEVEGVIRAVQMENKIPPTMIAGPPHLVLTLVSEGRAIKLRIPQNEPEESHAELLNAKVKVRGVCGTLFNEYRQLTGVQLFVPNLNQVQIEGRTAEDPNLSPPTPISKLTQFDPRRTPRDVVTLEGTVTLIHPGAWLYVQDRSGAILVESSSDVNIAVGDVVRASGMLSLGKFTPVLRFAKLAKTGQAALPEPLSLNKLENFSRDPEGRRVVVRGTLVDQYMHGADRVLTMNSAGQTFTALLAEADVTAGIRSLKTGSELQFTGIWSVGLDANGAAANYQVLLPSANSVVVLSSASWWTKTRIVTAAGIVWALLCAVTFIAFEMRRRVEERTAQLAAATREAQSASCAKSEFLAKVTHELRTPLNAVIGYSQMLQNECEDRMLHDLVPDLKRIEGSGRQLLEMVNDILDIAKMESGKMELCPRVFAVTDVVSDVVTEVTPLAMKNNNRIELRGTDDPLYLHADPMLFKQSLMNLMSNACKFTSNGLVAVEVNQAGDWLHVHVRDTGIGIAPEVQQQLFQPFTQADSTPTREFSGMGLGLTVSKQFTQLMGGDIHVESTLGEGSTFTLRLPFAQVCAPGNS